MHTMSTNFAKSRSFSVAVGGCLKSTSFYQCRASNPQFPSFASLPKPRLNPISVNCAAPSLDFRRKPCERLCFLKKSSKFGARFGLESAKVMSGARQVGMFSGFRLRSSVQCNSTKKVRKFSSLDSQRVEEGSGVMRAGKALPWLELDESKDSKRSQKITKKQTGNSSWEKSANWLDKKAVTNTGSSWVNSTEKFNGDRGLSRMKRGRVDNVVVDRHRDRKWRHDDFDPLEEGEKEDEEAEAEVGDDPRWNAIKSRVRGVVDMKSTVHPRVQRWNKQENWGKKTWKEASEGSPPKLVGEGVYGVGPVLAALSAGRREFYALYFQEGLDLSSSNKKKKDKKGFEKVLKMAEKIGLSVKDTTKHDLNMVVDNRPHQGLVLDASPLEMVKIMELDPVSDEDEGSLWVALDEVTDPQNLGAIIRSAYFFGASGVVLCAKNSAPLSGVVSKASAGSLELMELRYCKNMMQFLISSAENGWRVLGGSVSNKSVPLDEISPGVPTILVLGSEGTGLRPLVERSCTQLIRIPGNISADVTSGGLDDVEDGIETKGSAEEFKSFLAVESLNVSVAAGVLLHHLIGRNKSSEHALANESTDQ